MFISFEGIDGCGKSTQARLLAEALRAEGRTVRLTREPGGSPGAEEIRRLLVEGEGERWSAETELLLFTAARRDHVERLIAPALMAGEVVITDRFADSTRVYQGAGRADLRGLVDDLHRLMIGVEPDRTFLIDLDASQALARTGLRAAASEAQLSSLAAKYQLADIAVDYAERAARHAAEENRFESLGLEFQQRLREGFHELALSNPLRVRLIDGRGSTADVAARVRAAL